jgi:ABC-type multidrug transport system ATPase subunit
MTSANALHNGGKPMEVRIEQLTKSYGNRPPALDHIDITIPSGIFGLLGPNGAGKSTLMQILATILPQSSGNVRIGPYTLGKDDPAIRQILGYLPQEFGLYKKLTGEEFLDYVAIMKGIKDAGRRKRQIAELLERLNMSAHARTKIARYSGGMKQRIGIAQALLGEPKLVIVDEPTAGLDPEERIRFRNLLDEWSAGRVILLSTHIVSDIETSCTRLAILRKGKIVFNGGRQELAAKAEGKVWTGTVSEREADELRSRFQVVNSRRTAAGLEVRVIADGRPFPEAQPAAAGLEDGYILTMGADAV